MGILSDIVAMARDRRPALQKRPVAWRVEIGPDQWRLYDNEERAFREAESTGAVMQGLYVRDGT